LNLKHQERLDAERLEKAAFARIRLQANKTIEKANGVQIKIERFEKASPSSKKHSRNLVQQEMDELLPRLSDLTYKLDAEADFFSTQRIKNSSKLNILGFDLETAHRS